MVKDFVYKEHAYYSSKSAARKTTFFLGVLGVIILTPLSKLVRPFLKNLAKDQAKLLWMEGFFKCKFVVNGEDGSQKIYKMHASGDPGYKVTSKLVCESAVSLLGDHSLLPGGESWGGIFNLFFGDRVCSNKKAEKCWGCF